MEGSSGALLRQQSGGRGVGGGGGGGATRGMVEGGGHSLALCATANVVVSKGSILEIADCKRPEKASSLN